MSLALAERIRLDIDPSDRPAWLERRRQGVGASDVAGILGISPYASPFSVWGEKVGLLGEEPSNEVMEAGRWLELAIAPWFTSRTGLHVAGEQTFVEAGDGLAFCTLDGFVTEAPTPSLVDPLGNLQIKTAGFGKKWDPIPAHHQAQCQWEMYVTGLEREWLAVLMGRRLDVHLLERDEGDIAFIKSRVDRFWEEHVLTGTPPATDGHDATLRALAEVYPTHTPDKSVELDELADVIAEWRAAVAQRLAAKPIEDAAKAAIAAALGDAEEGTVAGERAVSFRQQTRKSYVVKESKFRVLRDLVAKEEESAA